MDLDAIDAGDERVGILRLDDGGAIRKAASAKAPNARPSGRWKP